MSPVLWHSLDIWRVIRGIAHGQVEDAIADLLACSTEFNVENWSVVYIHYSYIYIQVYK